MKQLALTILLLLISVPLMAPAADGFRYRNRKLSEYVLTPREYSNLNLDQKVSYVKFFLVFMATVEDMQTIPVKEKHALLEKLEEFIALFEPRANAAEYRVEGATCMYSLTLSRYVRSGTSFVCAPPPVDSNSSRCTGGQVGCGSAFATLVAGQGGVCITPPRAGTYPGPTALCVQKIASLTGITLDRKISDQILASSAAQRAQMETMAAGMRTALTTFQDQQMPGGLTLRAYCANGNAVNANRQREECDSLLKLADVFDANTVLGQDTFRPGSVVPAVPPATRAALAQIRALSDQCGPQVFDPTRDPSDTTCPQADPPYVAAPPPAAASAAGKETDAVPESFDSPSPPPPGSGNKEDDVVPETPPPPGSGNKEDDVVPETPPPTLPPRKEDDVVPEPHVPRPPTPPTDCMTRYQASLGPLACVACGLESKREASLRNGGGASKWIAMLGALAQTYHGPYNVNDHNSRQAYQRRVAEMVVSYGYCTNREFPDSPGITPSTDATRRTWIDGSARLNDGYNGGDRERNFAASFGLMSDRRNGFLGIQAQHVQNWNRPMCYGREMFDDVGGSRFQSDSVAERQWRFRSMAAGFRASFPNSGFSQCARAIEGRLGEDSLFRMCTIIPANNSKPVIRPIAMTDTEWANNQSLYSAIANKCEFSSPRPVERDCDGGCESSTLFPRATELAHCRPRPPPESGGGEPENPRQPPGDNREEPSTDRGTRRDTPDTPAAPDTPSGDNRSETESQR